MQMQTPLSPEAADFDRLLKHQCATFESPNRRRFLFNCEACFAYHGDSAVGPPGFGADVDDGGDVDLGDFAFLSLNFSGSPKTAGIVSSENIVT